MQITRLRAKNQITLPANVVAAVGLKQGDLLRVSAEQDQVIITARELHDRGRTYTMSDPCLRRCAISMRRGGRGGSSKQEARRPEASERVGRTIFARLGDEEFRGLVAASCPV